MRKIVVDKWTEIIWSTTLEVSVVFAFGFDVSKGKKQIWNHLRSTFGGKKRKSGTKDRCKRGNFLLTKQF